MRYRILILISFVVAVPVMAKDVYLSIGGTVGNFRTDMRIFNPSATKDITINAAFLEAGGRGDHPNNNGIVGKNITIPKRSMVVHDDVVFSLFTITGKLGAIRLTSPDDFVATQRIYANEAAGTLGQFVPGLDLSTAYAKGVLLQMKSNGGKGARGTFRTNVGFVNPANATTTATLRLYDRTNALVGAAKTITLQPFGVISPTAISGYEFDIGSADLSDAWMSYEATNPIFAYASVLDNGTEDPTFVPMSQDSGVTPPQVTEKVFTVTLEDGLISFAPAPTGLTLNDDVLLRITTIGGSHGFSLVSPTGNVLVPSFFLGTSNGTVEKRFKILEAGTHSYFCTNSACSAQHGSMSGTFNVGDGTDDPGRGY